MMPNQVSFTIRTVTPADSTGILDCLSHAFEPYREAYTPPGYEDTIMSADTIGRRFSEMTLFVAEAPDGVILGTIGCQILDGDEGHIRGMAVLPELQGSGVARALLERVERELQGSGCRRITLDTTAVLKRAARFYERNGYRKSGVVGDFFGMPLFEYVKEVPGGT